MHSYSSLHKLTVIVSFITLLVIAYATILVTNFKTPEATVDFFHNSNAYYYIAEIIKTDIRNRYPMKLRTNVIQLTVADTLLNTIVSPNLIERLSLPVLRLRQKVATLPLSFAEDNLVLNTKQYTESVNQTLSSLQLPPGIIDAGKNLITAVPAQITVIDTKKNPNSMLVTITKTRILFEHIQTILSISWVLLIISLVIFIFINIAFLKRLVQGIIWIFGLSGILLLLLSYLTPWIVSLFSSNPDPIAGVLKDKLVEGLVLYYFSLTRSVSIIFLIIAAITFLIYYFVPFSTVQAWINLRILRMSKASPQVRQTKGKK